MSDAREVRVLELATTCPDCSGPFQVTASMRQIKTRQLVRRCPSCRKIRSGPVAIAAPVPRKAAKRKKAPGRKARRASRRPATREFEPGGGLTLIEVRPVDVLPGETPAATLQRALAQVLDRPAPVGPSEARHALAWPLSIMDSYKNVLGMLD
jgi:hypothetical protein